jgi:predicted ATPase/DNA-binding CsgD family transcriptional regulator
MAGPTRRPGNLPAEATSFIGRRRELAELRKKLTTARVVSLVGPGGVGKTRFAIRAATDLGRGFSGGAWLVELAEVRDPGLIGNAVMSALNLRDQAGTKPLALALAYLRDRELLLVVDNCEHLLGQTAQVVSEVMRTAPGVRLIVTSREPLTVPGEHVIPVPPLELPSAHADEPLHQLLQNEAVALFVERAEAASGDFELTTSNQAAVADVCRRLDGLPLAIELAAVRTRVLSVEQILDRLTDRFGLLTGGSRAALPRHQTLGTTIDWSHDLLEPAERALLRRLCVFAGRFTLEDLEAVCTADPDVPPAQALDLMSSLVDKSLVMKTTVAGLACYRLHETMREYASLKLREAAEEEVVETRFTRHYVSRCLLAAAESRYRLLEWLPWMDLEMDNVRSVLRLFVERGDSVRGLTMVTAVGWYWITRATTEGARWLDELLASGEGHAWAYFIRGFLAVLMGDELGARPVLERAIAVARKAGQFDALTHSLAMASIAESMAGHAAAARRLLDEAQSIVEGLDDTPSALSVLQARALNGLFEGDLDAVASAATDGVRLSRKVGDLYSLGMMLMNLGSARLNGGDLDGAKALFMEALRIARQIDDRVAQIYLVGVMGCHAAMAGEPRLAAQLVGATETLRAEMGANVNVFLGPTLEQATKATTAALGSARFDAEVKAGAGYSREEAIRIALGEPASATADDGASGLLGRREEDVARLVANGLSNKQIGARLFISERTVESHVRSILNKLGFNSRAQIAGWMATPNP